MKNRLVETHATFSQNIKWIQIVAILSKLWVEERLSSFVTHYFRDIKDERSAMSQNRYIALWKWTLHLYFVFWQKKGTIIPPSGTTDTENNWFIFQRNYVKIHSFYQTESYNKLGVQTPRFPTFLIEMLICPIYPEEILMLKSLCAAQYWGCVFMCSWCRAVLWLWELQTWWAESSSSWAELTCLSTLHQIQQLTSLCHKTWQQLIRPNFWSDNPIQFFSVGVGIWYCVKLILCFFCAAVLKYHLPIDVWSVGQLWACCALYFVLNLRLSSCCLLLLFIHIY